MNLDTVGLGRVKTFWGAERIVTYYNNSVGEERKKNMKTKDNSEEKPDTEILDEEVLTEIAKYQCLWSQKYQATRNLMKVKGNYSGGLHEIKKDAKIVTDYYEANKAEVDDHMTTHNRRHLQLKER